MNRETKIFGVLVTHNTSLFAELAVRSLFQNNDLSNMDLKMHVLDNASNDYGLDSLKAYLIEIGVPIIQTGFDNTVHSAKHYLPLERFIRDYTECSYYLFLDSDVWFEEHDIIPTLLQELEDAGEFVFANQAQNFEYFAGKVIEGRDRIAGEGGQCDHTWQLDIAGKQYDMSLAHRCSPACCLVKNTPLFHRIVDIIGLGSWWTMHRPCTNDILPGYNGILYDTFGLMTHVMATHGMSYMISSTKIMHYTNVVWRPKNRGQKEQDCMERLAKIRGG